jgi:pyridinium-3,5-bisthiocarboxylic acid mononucleotide nickel chelatase
MRIGYLECSSGISGDMFLGALVDAGVPLETLQEAAAALNIGARLEARKVMRGGVSGTKVYVIAEGSATPATMDLSPGAPAGAGDQGSEDSYSHSHAHTHEHEHSHDGGLTHSHPHTHQHLHSHTDAHEHDPLHEHDHPHEHAHDHVHEHGHAHDRSEPHTHVHHRPLSEILEIIAAAALDAGVKERAARAFQLLGEAEAAIHSIPVEQVHFHEVGAVDTIADIVCAAAGAAALKVDRWISTPLNVGSGTVQCAHGTLPVPAPATLSLLGSAPIYSAGPAMERVTPTGAAVLRMLNVEFAALPAMRTQAAGYGAGGRETPGQPNLLRLMVGEAESGGEATEPIAVLEAVIDDSTPQLLAYACELLLAAGAWDVYRIPVAMKKGRTGVQLTILCAPERLPALREILFRETTTIGAHWRIESKMALRREFAEIATPWGTVKIKIARSAAGEVLNASPEYEDCRRIAAKHGIPLKQVMADAARLYAVETRAKAGKE